MFVQQNFLLFPSFFFLLSFVFLYFIFLFARLFGSFVTRQNKEKNDDKQKKNMTTNERKQKNIKVIYKKKREWTNGRRD